GPEQFLPYVRVLVWDSASAIWSPPDASPPRRFVAVSWLGDGPSPRCWFAATSRSRERAPRLVGSFQTIAVVLSPLSRTAAFSEAPPLSALPSAPDVRSESDK